METLPRGAYVQGSPKPLKRQFETFELIGRCPKYSRPLDNTMITKMAREYQSWKQKLEALEVEQAISQFENRNNPDASPPNPVAVKPDFDPSYARILIETTKQRRPNAEHLSPLSTPKPLLHKRPFRVTPKSSFGIPNYDKATSIRNEECAASAQKRILMLDAIDLKQKQEKTRILAKAAREKRERERDEKLQLGLSLQQGWAVAKVKAMEDAAYRAKYPPSEAPRPITAETQEAMNELDRFDKRMREEKKRKALEEERQREEDLRRLCQDSQRSSVEQDVDDDLQ